MALLSNATTKFEIKVTPFASVKSLLRYFRYEVLKSFFRVRWDFFVWPISKKNASKSYTQGSIGAGIMNQFLLGER